jgi:hypothetical protein
LGGAEDALLPQLKAGKNATPDPKNAADFRKPRLFIVPVMPDPYLSCLADFYIC